MSVETQSETSGRRIVGYIYGTAVVVAAVFGYIVGIVIQPNVGNEVGQIGPIVFELHPLNLALYGAIMVGVSLGAFFLVAAYAIRLEADSTS